ncbi:hypothetical protein ACS0TY_016133 [Phlomoides rotata]
MFEMSTSTTAVTFLVAMLIVHHGHSVDTLNIFILGGQSNMAGRGSLEGLRADQREPSPNILRFSANYTWEEAVDPLHCDIDLGKYCGVGPGMLFAKTILQRDPNYGLIGLVPCAVGDTSITEWSKGTHLYDKMVVRAREAVLAGGGIIRALLWNQGEKDTLSSQDALSYKIKFKKFINDLRSDLQLPSLPVVEVALDFENNGSCNIDLVRKAQFETAVELQDVRCVDAKGLEISHDHVHLTTAAQLKLGAMMADAFLGNQAMSPSPAPSN